MNFARIVLIGLLALPLGAQTLPVSVGGSIIFGMDSYRKVVNNSTGFMVDVGWDAHLAKNALPARFSISLGSMPGKETNGLKTSLTLFQFSTDLLLKTDIENLRGVFGLALNMYRASLSGTESTAAADVDHHFPFHDVDGVKGGLRLGAEYTFRKHFTAQILLQATELAGSQRTDRLQRRGGLNPAWVQCGVRYSF